MCDPSPEFRKALEEGPELLLSSRHLVYNP